MSNNNTLEPIPQTVGSMLGRTNASKKKAMRDASSRQRFQNRLSFALTATTLLLLGVLSVFFGTSSELRSTIPRWLEDANDDASDDAGNNNNNDDDGDYSKYSCQYIYDEVSEPEDLCNFARTCNDGEGVWAPWIFCSSTFGTYAAFGILSPIVVVWMVTLFKLLGSTAEDFFSCSLEMFSVKLGLPPRFAGVTLLALGNGAADVSATVSAILSDAENGYKLSLGALTGAAMLVGGVVSGVVVLVADGVKCRGALIRDVSALVVTVIVVWRNLSSGVVTRADTTLFFGLYLSFISSVLAADIYHRTVVVPRLEAIAAAVGDAEVASPPPNAFMRIVTSISNYDNTCVTMAAPNPPPSPLDEAAATAATAATAAASTTTTTTTTTTNSPPSIAMTDVVGSGAAVDDDQPIVLHGQNGILSPSPSRATATAPGSSLEVDDGGGMYTLVEDHIDRVCIGAGSAGSPSYNWMGAWQDGKQEISAELRVLWDQIVSGGNESYYGEDGEGDELKMYERCLLLFEFPFTLFRKATIPIPCEGYYNRGFVALSMALAPLWFSYYLLAQHDINLWSEELFSCFLIYFGVSCVIGLLILRFAPGGEGNMSLVVATPIAFYGFVMAATWIDWIADRLVAVLNFVGIVLHIPGAVMGLTVLAWGNSVGDLSANISMARKGLANMAMTACFAGPVFNILLGLGLGFRGLESQTGEAESQVSLSAPILAGFVFIVLNCVTILAIGIFVGKGRIETSYGYVAVTLYAIYIVTSITLEFRS